MHQAASTGLIKADVGLDVGVTTGESQAGAATIRRARIVLIPSTPLLKA